MLKALKITGFVLLIAAISLGVYYYFNPKKALHIILPDVSSLRNVSIKLEEDTARVDLDLVLKNKGWFKLHLDSLYYRIQLDTSTLLSKQEYLDLQLKRGQTDSLHLPVAFPFKRMMKEVKSLQGQDSVDVPINVRLTYSTLFGKAVLPYSKLLRIEVPHPPKFELEKVEFVKRHKGSFYFNAHIRVHNYGKLDLNVSDVRYHLVLKELAEANGQHVKEISIKPGTDQLVVLPVKAELKNFFKTIGLFFKKEKVPYHLEVKGFIQNDKFGKKRTPVEIEKDGLLKLRK